LRKFTTGLLTVACLALSGVAVPDTGPYACEEALNSLVEKLEAEGQFNESTRKAALPGDESEYAPCLVRGDNPYNQDEVTYVVLRHSDDVTVFVSRSSERSDHFDLFGPFYSAYRK
jgi:hypothetical protein